jgi:hypothetical protein
MINSTTTSQKIKQKLNAKAAKLEEEKTKKIDTSMAIRTRSKIYT